MGTSRSQKNDPNDARSVAIAALRSDRAAHVSLDARDRGLRLLAKRHRDMARIRPSTAPDCTRFYSKSRRAGSRQRST